MSSVYQIILLSCLPIPYSLFAVFTSFMNSIMMKIEDWTEDIALSVLDETSILLESLLLTLTYVILPLSRMKAIVLGPMFISSSNLETSCNLTLSNASARSIKHMKAGLLYSVAFSAIYLSMNIASMVDLFCQNPCWCSLWDFFRNNFWK